MGSRRAYRGIEEAALLGNFVDSGCPHNHVSRRLRYFYRESRDAMRLRSLRTLVSAATYGNPQLDAAKGRKSAMKSCDVIDDMVYYYAAERKMSDHATLDYRNVNTQVMLLRELRKNVSKEVAIGEVEGVFGKIKVNEVHVLGGKSAGSRKAGKSEVV